MFVVAASRRVLGIACLSVLFAGCYPLDQSAPEENHPYIKAAMARKSGSPQEAARLLEKALEDNPRLARAHWELGLIRLNSTSNYAAAVYHFQKVLELRPDWPHASTTRQLISNAKLELVKEGIEAPTLPSAQRQMDRLIQELHALSELKSNLLARVDQLTVVTQRLAAENLGLRQQLLALNQPLPVTDLETDPNLRTPLDRSLPGERRGPDRSSPVASSMTSPGMRRPDPTTPPAALRSGPRPYTVRRGETAFAISRRYGLSVRDLVAANPGLDPARLKAGQTINLPAR